MVRSPSDIAPNLCEMRVLVLTAPVGEGHLSAARAIAEGIERERPGSEVVTVDALEELGAPVGWIVRDAYRWQLARAPWLFAALFGALKRSRALRSFARAGVSIAGSRQILHVVDRYEPDVIVSTWPVTTTILGCLRLRGRIGQPVCATITDFAGLPMWVDKGVDLHLVMHPSLVGEIEHLAGADSARAVSPLVGTEFLQPRTAVAARASLGLPARGQIVLVSGGGWAVGDLDGAVTTALATSAAAIVCLAGRNLAVRQRLDRAFADDSRVTVLGFTDRMSDLLAAADVLVHSTGGVTCLEAMARGCPIIAYRPPQGHSPLLAREMEALGLLVHARSTTELRRALDLREPRTNANAIRDLDAAALVLGMRPRVASRARARLARPLAMAAAMSVLVIAAFSSDLTYPLVAEAFSLHEATAVGHQAHTVALVVHGDRSSVLAFARSVQRRGLHASVVVDDPLTPEQVASLRRSGLDPIPGIRAQGIRSTLTARRQLEAQVRAYGSGRSFYFVAPREGFTITAYLLAHHLGGIPIQRGAALPGSPRDLTFQPGEVVMTTLAPGPVAAARLLRSWEALARTVTVSSVQLIAARSVA